MENNFIEILKIGVLDGLIWFPFVLGVGLLYQHLKVIDVSVDGVSVLCGISCAGVWLATHSYFLSIMSAVLCGLLLYTIVWYLIYSVRITPILAGILFSIVASAFSVVLVGESVVLTDTHLFGSFSSFSPIPVFFAFAVGLGSDHFFRTRLGTVIRFVGTTPKPNIPFDPDQIRWLGFAVTALIIGGGSAIYVHKQAVARSGLGFDFLITSLSSFLLVDRVFGLLAPLLSKNRASRKYGLILIRTVVGSVAFRALTGSIIFQVLVLLIIANTPSPVYWKLLFGIALTLTVAQPRIKAPRAEERDDTGRKEEAGVVLKNVSVNFDRGHDSIGVFESLHLNFRPGMNYIWGPNGSGKSTLLNVIKGIVDVNAGRVFLDHIDVTELPAHLRRAFLVTQDAFQAISPDLLVIENLAVSRFTGQNPLSTCSVREVADQPADMVLSSASSAGDNTLLQRTSTLSGGQAQRLLFQMSLHSGYAIILADEPTSGLDIENFRQVVEILELMSASGKTVVVATHDHRLSTRTGVHFQIEERKLRERSGL